MIKKIIKSILKPVIILRQNFIYNAQNKSGVSVGDRKLIVIESDDWGSIRVPSAEVKRLLNDKGGCMDVEPFTRTDGIESAEDLKLLIDELSAIKDKNGNSPVITAFYAMRNADFDKIRQNNFKDFYSEKFEDTILKYDNNNKLIEVIKEGISKKVFYPQLHCLEHLNRSYWIKHLQNGNENTRLAFDYGLYGVGTNFDNDNKFGYMDAFHNRSEEELLSYESLIEQAVIDFESQFGYKPTVFTAPCYVWDYKLEEFLYKNGIRYMCGANYQLIPNKDNNYDLERVNHSIGQISDSKITYLTRNVDFELIYNVEQSKLIKTALKRVEYAFKNNKPAVISIHRANFSSRLGDENRSRLDSIKEFLLKILSKWPDVEFVNSNELGEIISRNMQNGRN